MHTASTDPLARDRPGALGVAIGEACGRFGQADALIGDHETLSYAALDRLAADIAGVLTARGVSPFEPVHVMVSNQPRDVAALFGVWRAGGVAVPIHRTTPSALVAGLERKTSARFRLDLTGPASESIAVIADAVPACRPLLDGAAFVIYTSGSTGTPKGVVVSHAAFAGKIEQIDRLLAFAPDDRTLLVLNITFSFGLWVSLLTLLRGGALVMKEKFEPASFAATLVGQSITRVGMVPTMMRVLFSNASIVSSLDAVNAHGRLRQVLLGGEALGRSLAESIRARFRAAELIDIYGSTETATCDFFAFPSDYAQFPGAVGRASPNVSFRIVDGAGDASEYTFDDGIGELQIRSPYLMNGYLDEPALTQAAFDDGWFRTGDLARVVGTVANAPVVELMGRSKEIISRGGNKVTPVEIEQAVSAHPDVAAAMAVGVADAVLGERIHVLVVPRAGVALEIDAVRRFLEAGLERFKHPDTYYLADALPLGRTGKADRGQLKASIASGALRPS